MYERCRDTNNGLSDLLEKLFVAVFIYVATMLRKNKYNRFVGLVQWVFEGLLKQIDAIIPDKKLARKITPLAVTIFFAVLFNYLFPHPFFYEKNGFTLLANCSWLFLF